MAGTIDGTSGDDRIHDVYTGDPENDAPGEGNDLVYGGAGNDTIWTFGGDDTLYGGEGNDLLVGGAGNDTLDGGEGDDTVWGEDGADVIIASRGNDCYLGGSGGLDCDTLDLREIGRYEILYMEPDENGNGYNGTIALLDDDGLPTGEQITFFEIETLIEPDDPGGPVDPEPTGPDGTVEGTAGNDVIDTSYEGDPEGDKVDNDDALLDGHDGNDDLIYAKGGDDTVIAGDGQDTVHGGDGNDVIYGGDGGLPKFDNPYPPLSQDPDPYDDMDTLYGGAGDDTIYGGDDADRLYGGKGDDVINGGIDNDYIQGDKGDDTIIGGEGSDVIIGGAGDDVIYGGYGPDLPDELNIRDDQGDLVTDNGKDVIFASAGNDTVYGLDDDDTIFGQDGNDYLDGGIDDDLIYGGRGNDTIIGGQGNDSLYGNNDRDIFIGGNGGDHVDGGAGGDDFDTLDLTGTDVDYIEYTSKDKEDGIVHFKDGTTMTFVEIENVIPCFTPGTAIATPRGEVPVESLREGDRIITRDNGIQEIRWVGRKDVTARDLFGAPQLKPVLIKAGALGNGLPERDMMVSPNHRLLVASERTQLYFEESEVLAAAKHLVGMPGVMEVEVASTAYIHFMFDRHQVVLSNGAWTESFQPGDYTLKGIGDEQRDEIFLLFPELKSHTGLKDYQAARKSLKRHEAQLLAR
ncbi:Hint domain-containing protein [Pseudoroseicyclus sp. CXY001]|uniref:Hint domain-containing protein n=1 Tax=Pseudoroseicyclus sp. CXY001 TaxID=3242492 RepID=UPI00358DAD50